MESFIELKDHFFSTINQNALQFRPSYCVAAILVAIASIAVINIVHQRYFSPLSHIPGPWWAGSTLNYCRLLSNGTFNNKVRELHEKYGDVVRVAPSEVSFICGEEAWDEIYGFRAGSKKSATFLKDQYWIAHSTTPAMIMADGADHTRFRRLLSHAFSSRALRDQEPQLQACVDLFIDGIRKESQARSDGVVDLINWFNRLTVDVISGLTFGKPFDCLTKGNDSFIEMINGILQAGAQGRVSHLHPVLGALSVLLGLQIVPVSALKTIPKFFKFTTDLVSERLSSEGDHTDFIAEIVKHDNVEGKGLTRDELDSNCVQFLIAGSETSATALSGIAYLLCTHQEYMQRLTKELRNCFPDHKAITFDAISSMPLLNAVINEGLRLYPPVPTGFPRIVPPGGATVGKYYLPEKTVVYMSQFAANHSGRNFVEPGKFWPERWMGDPKADADMKKVYQPFSYGPRVCIGKGLAYAEMRLALAKLLYHFDLELTTHIDNWMDQKVWVTWSKHPLLVKLRPVKGVQREKVLEASNN